MAVKSKHPHVRIDERIWDDPVMIHLSDAAFKAYIFGIAWSKCQQGRTPDGLLTQHGLGRIGATEKIVQELVQNNLLEECEEGYRIPKYEEWQMTSEEERVEAERAARRVESGKQSAVKRWKELPPVEEGFDPDKAFEEAWSAWPEPSEPKYREKREEAYEAFRLSITNAKDFDAFSHALMKRIKDYEHESGPKADRRWRLGAFRNFCTGTWRDWIPKGYGLAPKPEPEKKAAPPPVEDDSDFAKKMREKLKKKDEAEIR